jgi:hypothetical protein
LPPIGKLRDRRIDWTGFQRGPIPVEYLVPLPWFELPPVGTHTRQWQKFDFHGFQQAPLSADVAPPMRSSMWDTLPAQTRSQQWAKFAFVFAGWTQSEPPQIVIPAVPQRLPLLGVGKNGP